MIKKKTSKKRELSTKDIPVSHLKKSMKVYKINAVNKMKDRKYISKALWECLITADTEAFKEILKTHLELMNKDSLSEKTGLSRRTLFRMLSPQGNPTLENLSRLMRVFCTE